MIKHTIKEIYFIAKEIEMWQEELAELQNDSGYRSPAFDTIPQHTNRKAEPVADLVARREKKIKQLEIRIAEKVNELIDLKDEIYQYIDTLEDSQLRQIINYKFIRMLTWEEVALKVGGGNTADACRKRFERHFSTIE